MNNYKIKIRAGGISLNLEREAEMTGKGEICRDEEKKE